MMLTIGAMGAITPNIQACFLEYYPKNGGTAAALLGAAQFGIAGSLSALSTLLPQMLSAVILAMTTCALVSMLVLWYSLFLHQKGTAQQSKSATSDEWSALE